MIFLLNKVSDASYKLFGHILIIVSFR